ncbi:vacuolating cytotoxin domain-containing protein, partial [Helicobacter pylori]
MTLKKAKLISGFISKRSFKLDKVSRKFFPLNRILKREKSLKRHKKALKPIKKPFNKNKSFLKASVLLIGALGGLSHLRASDCKTWSWSSWTYQDNIASGANSPTHNSYCLFSSAQGSGTYYLNTLTTYSSGGASFTQKFNGGTLDVGGNIRFGEGGYLGYITGTYDAQTIDFNSSHITTGNGWSGGGATLNFNATNNLAINQASFDNSHAGTQHSYMNFKGSQISVSGSSFKDDTNGGFSFSGNNNNSAISFNQTSFNQGTYKFSNSASSSFDSSNFNQGTYNFNSDQSTFQNSSFNQGTYDFSNNASFNNDTFNQGTYSFNASKVSFSGANTLNSSSPFASLKGGVSFGSNAIFNLNQTLNANQTYDILTTNGAIQYGVYQSYLWDLINYKGDKAISHVEVGKNTYDVTFDVNGQDETLQETFNSQSIIAQFLGDDLQQQAQNTYKEDLTNSQSALNNATSDN